MNSPLRNNITFIPNYWKTHFDVYFLHRLKYIKNYFNNTSADK